MRLPNQTPGVARYGLGPRLSADTGIEPSWGSCWSARKCSGKKLVSTTDYHNCCGKYSGKSFLENGNCRDC